ncbi:MAG: cysteine desulfurase, partial [Clostridia bacterium]|nr:cysteine desulfurase [Clostridia bacterium]
MQRIYLDHAATTPLSKTVLEKMLPYFTENFGNADSPHAIGRRAVNAVDGARDSVAAMLGAKSNEIYFTSGGTEADNWAIIGGAYAQKQKGKDHVIVSSIEHHAVLYAAEKLKKEGFQVTYLPVNEGGMVAPLALKEALTPKTGLVAVMAVNNETGVLQPIQALAQIAKENGALFFTDAVQAAPYLPLDVKALGVDMLSLSSHKFFGPKGCGVLYIKSGVKVERFVGGGEQERGLRGGTTNVPAVVGLAAAYEENAGGMSASNEKISRLSKLFLDGISVLDGVEINGEGEKLPGVLNLRVKGVSNVDLLYKLDLQGVCVAVGSACASGSIDPSHVLLAMGLTEKAARE